MKRLFFILVSIFILHRIGVSQVNDKIVDSLLNIVTLSKDTSKCVALKELQEYYRRRDPEKCLEYSRKCHECASIMEHDKLVFNSKYYIGSAFLTLNEHDSARFYFDLFYNQAVKKRNKKKTAFALCGLASTMFSLRRYNESVRYSTKGLKIAREISEVSLIHYFLNNLSSTYSRNNDNKKSLAMSFQILNMQHPSIDSVSALKRIGMSYMKLNQSDSARFYYNLALNIEKKAGKKVDASSTLLLLVDLYYQVGDIKNSRRYLDEYYSLSKGIKIPVEQESTFLFDARLLVEEGKPEEAIKALDEIIGVLKERQDYYLLWLVYRCAGNAYQKLNNASKVYETLILSENMKDSVYAVESAEKTADLLKKYETEKKDQEIAILAKEKELQKTRIEKVELTNNSLIIGLCLLLLLISILVFSYLRKQKTDRLLHSKDEDIKKQKDIMRGQEMERERIAKELHDGLGGSLASIKMNLSNMVPSNSEKLNYVITNLDDAYKEVRNISHDLMPLALKNAQLTSAIESYLHRFNTKKNFKIDFEYFPEKSLNKLPQEIQLSIYRIIQELITNSIKHAEATFINIGLSVENNQVELIVEDNGMGFDIRENMNGVGLKSVDSRTKLLGGKLEIDTKKGRGSAFYIRFAVETEMVEQTIT